LPGFGFVTWCDARIGRSTSESQLTWKNECSGTMGRWTEVYGSASTRRTSLVRALRIVGSGALSGERD
jgi:hypothetical protein